MYDHIPTPAIVIDSSIVQRNIKRMGAYAKSHGLNLRPHTKTHKSAMIGKLQLDAGAIGLTVAKVGEAEVMSTVCDDILMAYPPIGEQRCQRLATLASKVTIRLGLDSLFAAQQLSQATQSNGSTAGVIIDFDLGYGRTGLQTVEQAVELGRSVDRLSGLRLDGIMLYTGHVLGTTEEMRDQFKELQAKCEELLDAWEKDGLCHDIVSSGSTPCAFQSELLPAATEIRPGTYVYNDMNIVHGGYGNLEDCAARIHATVISDAVEGQIVLDAGSKTLTSDLCGPKPDSGHGFIVEYPQAKITSINEEHGKVDITRCSSRPVLGERVTIVPNHICVCTNMQDYFWWQVGDELTQHPVDARGCLV